MACSVFAVACLSLALSSSIRRNDEYRIRVAEIYMQRDNHNEFTTIKQSKSDSDCSDGTCSKITPKRDRRRSGNMENRVMTIDLLLILRPTWQRER